MSAILILFLSVRCFIINSVRWSLMKFRRVISFVLALTALVSFPAVRGTVSASETETAQTQKSISAPASFKVSERKSDKITLSWKKVRDAQGYKLQMKKDGKYETVTETENTAFTVSGLICTRIYHFRLRAYKKENGKTVSSDYIYLKTVTSPDKVIILSKTSDNRRVTIKWEKQRCTGFYLQLSEKSDFSDYKRAWIENKNAESFVTKKLSASTKYYFRIRAYVEYEGKKYYSDRTEFTVKTDKGYKTTSKGFKIETKNGFTYVDGVLIANKTYSLPKDYNPGGLTKECNSAFSKMKAAAQKDGVNLFIVSGFRSYDTQKRIYNNYVSRDGKAKADTYSARPGSSEHQTGLAMDLNSLKTSFGETKEGKWLSKNCYKYGFIIRYPKGKQSVTGYIYEPWHVRYIGKDKAAAIYKSGLCLEEYYGITSKYQ